jgi:hypothetical protein
MGQDLSALVAELRATTAYVQENNRELLKLLAEREKEETGLPKGMSLSLNNKNDFSKTWNIDGDLINTGNPERQVPDIQIAGADVSGSGECPGDCPIAQAITAIDKSVYVGEDWRQYLKYPPARTCEGGELTLSPKYILIGAIGLALVLAVTIATTWACFSEKERRRRRR